MPKSMEAADLYEIKIILLYLEPAIWRRVTVPKDITLGSLHAVIQVAMGWEDDHLHEFQIGKKRYGPVMSDPFGGDEEIVHLNGVAQPRAKFIYQYDFGDDWTHEIHVEREVASATAKRRARCVAGENACPPEDCGGPPGYANMLEVLANPTHEDYDEMREWVADDFDPQRFDVPRTDRRLSKVKV